MCPDFHLHWHCQPSLYSLQPILHFNWSNLLLPPRLCSENRSVRQSVIKPLHRHARPRWQWGAETDLYCVYICSCLNCSMNVAFTHNMEMAESGMKDLTHLVWKGHFKWTQQTEGLVQVTVFAVHGDSLRWDVPRWRVFLQFKGLSGGRPRWRAAYDEAGTRTLSQSDINTQRISRI